MLQHAGSSPEQKETHSLPALLRQHYRRLDKLPPSPLDAREHAIVAVQLSLIETQKKVHRLHREEADSKADAKQTQTSQPRDLQTLLEKEESALDYYEAWHNVTRTLAVPGIFEASKPVQRVLVMGPAGIGKTTLLHYIAHQWSLGALCAERFQLVLWLPLRSLLKEEYQQARSRPLSIAQILYQECLSAETQKALALENFAAFLEQYKDKLLMLLDGYDECASVVEDEKSALNPVFQAMLELGKATLMTSRPYRLGPTLVKKFNRHLENRGFSDTQIQRYIADYFQENPSYAIGLNQLLSSQSRLQGMAHVPINLSLLCGLWQDESQRLPISTKSADAKTNLETRAATVVSSASTLTQTLNLSSLYQQLIGYLVKRYLKERKGVDTRTIEDVDIIMDACRGELNLLSRMAFLGLTERQILLPPELFKRMAQETRQQPQLLDAALRLGFLQKAGEASVRGEIYTPHYFIHLSFQEFFAARYLVESLKHPQTHTRYTEAIQFLSIEKYQPRYAMVFRFVAGLTSSDKSHDKPLLSFWKALLSKPFDITGVGHLCLMIRCLDEAWLDQRVPYRQAVWEQIFTAIKTTLGLADSTDVWLQPLAAHLRFRLLTDLQQTSMLGRAPALLDTLRETLEDNEKAPQVRNAAAEALGRLGAIVATEPMLKALRKASRDYNKDIRCAATWAWGQLGVTAATEAVLQALREASNDYDSNVRCVAIRAWGQLGATAVIAELVWKALEKALEDKEKDVRSAAIEVLGRLGATTATGSVLEILQKALLEDKEKDVQYAAAQALGQLGAIAATESVLQALEKALEDKNVRIAAAWALGQLGATAATESVLQILQKVLEDDKEELNARCTAARTLGQLGVTAATESILQALQKALKGRQENLRNAAAWALSQLGVTAATIEPMLQALRETLGNEAKIAHTRANAAETLGQLGPLAAIEPVLEALQKALKNWNSSVRNRAAWALGQLGATTEPVLKALREALKDKDEYVQATAAWVLGRLGVATEPVLQALRKALKDKKEDVRRAAAGSLLGLSRPTVLTTYLQAAVSPIWGVDKKYAQSTAGILLQSTALVCLDQQLHLYDGQISFSHHVTTKNQQASVKALLGQCSQQAKVFGLPLMVQEAYLTGKETFSITIKEETTDEKEIANPVLNAIAALDQKAEVRYAHQREGIAALDQKMTTEHAFLAGTLLDMQMNPFNEIIASVTSPVPSLVQQITTDAKESKQSEPTPVLPPLENTIANYTFKQKLSALIELEGGGFSFLIKRQRYNCLQLQFTAADKVLMVAEDIKKELIELTKLFKQAVSDLGIKTEQYKVESNWKEWTLTVTADPTILNKIGEFLHDSGVNYFQSAPQAKAVLFGTIADSSLSAASADSTEHQCAVTCVLQ